MFSGYLYLRQPSWSVEVIKMGSTEDIIKRDGIYRTGELIRGNYISAYECNNHLDTERKLQQHLKKYNIRKGAGIEFYNIVIIELVESGLKTLGIEYKKLTNTEINEIERKCVLDSLKDAGEELPETKVFEYIGKYQPRDYQIKIVK